MAGSRYTRLLIPSLAIAGDLAVGGQISAAGISGPITTEDIDADSITADDFNGQALGAGTVAGSNPVGVTYTRIGVTYFCIGTGAPVSIDVPTGSFYYSSSTTVMYFKYGPLATHWSRLHQDGIIVPTMHGMTVFSGGIFTLDTGIAQSNPLRINITADQTNWDPAGGVGGLIYKNTDIFVTSDASRVINSMYRSAYRQVLRIWNKNALASGRTLTLTNEDGATVTATRRFACVGNANYVIQPGGCAYVHAEELDINRWCVGA